jgi:CHAT domain-containing protein
LTLSACDTAKGTDVIMSRYRDETAGREVEGFAALAQKQGAESVMATLWSIDDKSTSEFMSSFYKLMFQKGENRVSALQQVQLDFIEGIYSHPHYWAPFILMGNWR